jgi:malonyl-CoA/methylmalonyl-CoA synthetase
VNRAPGWAAHLPAGVHPGGLDLAAGGTLPAVWARRWAADPGRPVLLDDAAGARVRAGALDAATGRLAGRLAGAGLVAGDRVLVSAATSFQLVVAILAALRLGLVVVPCNPAYTKPEVGHLARLTEPLAAVVDDPARGAWVREALGEAAPVVVTDPDLTGLPDGEPPGLDAAAPGDPALIVSTSGTTGTPRGAVATHANLLAATEALRLAWRIEPADRLVLALPLFHVHGLVAGLLGLLGAGGSVVLQPRFDAGAALAAIGGHRASLLYGVPTMWARLAAHPAAGELARLRLAVSGSAPLAPALFEAVAERSGQRVLERYGMTETQFTVSNPYDGERRPGTVGLPLPGVELRLDDTGQVLVRGPSVTPGYWGDPAQVVDGDGWLATGDLGRLDEAGYLVIEGRARDLIISGGLNVHPREVEDALLGHPNVAEVAVVGTPSEEWGELVTAVVVPDGRAPTLEELAAFVAGRLAPYKRPRLLRVVDALPRNAMGKLLRHELR